MDTTTKRWVAVLDPGLIDRATGAVRVRFIRFDGYKIRKGMYRNRRVVRVVPPVLTDDLAEAYRWRTPGEVVDHLVKFYGLSAAIKSWRIVRLDEEEETC